MKPVIVPVGTLVRSIRVKLPAVSAARARALMMPPPAPTVRAPVPERLMRSPFAPLSWKPSAPELVAPPTLSPASVARVAVAVVLSA